MVVHPGGIEEAWGEKGEKERGDEQKFVSRKYHLGQSIEIGVTLTTLGFHAVGVEGDKSQKQDCLTDGLETNLDCFALKDSFGKRTIFLILFRVLDNGNEFLLSFELSFQDNKF